MPNIFDQPGTLFPHTTSQSTWHFSLGENFLHLSDGTSTYSFIGKLSLKDAKLNKVSDVAIADFYNNAISKGKAQVHRSDPFSIYFTIQDGRDNPTYTLRHVHDGVWRVQTSGSGLKLVDLATEKAMRDETVTLDDQANVAEAECERNREQALMLQELVSTDPIISKFPTHNVVDAFQQMLRITPELSSEREVVRAFLRQAGHAQQIDQSQADELIAENVRLFKLHQASKRSPSRPAENACLMG